MQNPFDIIIERFNSFEEKLNNLNSATTSTQPEIINREELCKRLDITEPTAIRWEKKGTIPSFRIGSNVRYNWPKVVESLEGRQPKNKA